MGIPNYPKNLADEWSSLKRDVRGAATSANLRTGMAKIGAKVVEIAGRLDITSGTLNVFDDQNSKKVEIGLLSDGSYGLAAVDANGKLVKLSSLAFGPKAEYLEGRGRCATTNWGDLSTISGQADPQVGPVVSNVVIGDTGKCLVTLSCDMFYGAQEALSGGYMGFEISGATTRTPQFKDALGRLESHTVSGVETGTFSATDRRSFTTLVEGLTPGVHTFTAKYARNDNSYTLDFGYRTLIVQPF